MKAMVGMICAVAMALPSGCSTLNARHDSRARESILLENLESDVRRLQEKVDGLATAQQDIYEDLETLRRQQSKTVEEAREREEVISRNLKTLETGCAGIKQEVIESLSKKIKDTLAAGSATTTGREHVVKPGQTLSEIATAYGVQVKAIVSANKLKDADSIYAGQKLFIPE